MSLKYKFMLVDDSATIRQILKTCLENEGHSVIQESGNGKIALDFFDRGEEPLPDAITLDVNMPVMKGIDFLLEFRKREKFSNIKVIMCTTESEKSIILECLKQGANGYVTKPFRPESLMKKVNSIMEILK